MPSIFPKQLFEQPRYWLAGLLALMLALIATGFVLQYGFRVLPCEMCWWQRYAHMAVAVFAALGLLIQNPRAQQAAAGAIAAAALGGLAIACWQYAAQHGWLPFPAQCTSSSAKPLADAANLLASLKNIQIVPCDRETFSLLGLSLAGWNIPAMLVTIYVALRGGWRI
ncbi:MAG TPA: disulfide bond formation protein B [Alphaproteobacteria bacterium]|nr:disulfide bond formation protein B [Alphaproteobacteria bacterium]